MSFNATLCSRFAEMAALAALLGENKFKTIALERAARVFEELPQDASQLSAKELLALDGVGKGVADKVIELAKTGAIAEHEAMKSQVPTGVVALLGVPGLGPKTVAQLWKEAGVESVEVLRQKAEDGSLVDLKGFGEKKVGTLKKNLSLIAQAANRMRLDEALNLAEPLTAFLAGLPGVARAHYAGSARRGKESVGDLDLLVAADPVLAGGLFDAFLAHPWVGEAIGRGPTKCSARLKAELGAVQVDVRVVAADSFGAALAYFTGGKEHNVRLRERAIAQGMKLNEYGLFQEGAPAPVAAATEEAIHAALGLAFIPPELREDKGEIALAEQKKLPRLVEVADIRAELHSHTLASDGVMTIRELALNAAARGCHTVAVTDHSRSSIPGNGLSIERLQKHIAAVHAVAKEMAGTITILMGSEVDILSDGSLDYPDEILAQLDWVVASPHAALSQEPAVATRRLIAAAEHPLVHVIGHPTGRKVGRRAGLEPDMAALAKACAACGTALEINANPIRLDLRDTHARLVLEHGCKLSINTDAHHPEDMTLLRYGVLTARRAGARAQDVVNCWTAGELEKWRTGRREGRL